MRWGEGTLVLLVAVALTLSSCAVWLPWRPEPLLLPFPTRPALSWEYCYSAPAVAAPDRACLSFQDGDRLIRYMDQLNAFDHARRRLGGE